MTLSILEHTTPILDIPLHTLFQDGSQEWRLRRNLHRLDGPAIIYADDSQAWCIDDKRHRLDGPAVTRANGMEEWWVDDCDITSLSAHAKLVYIRGHQQAKACTSPIPPSLGIATKP